MEKRTIVKHLEAEKLDIGRGFIKQDFPQGEQLNVLHWDIADGSVLPTHSHLGYSGRKCVAHTFALRRTVRVYDKRSVPPYRRRRRVLGGRRRRLHRFFRCASLVRGSGRCRNT